MNKPILVIKIGSAVITNSSGYIDEAVIERLAKEVAALHGQYNVVLVSSGAVGSGKQFFKKYRGTLVERKAAAAVGNPILIRLYHQFFQPHGLTVAQALCERHHFSNRQQFLQLKETFAEFWRNDVLPVVNENDLVSNVELKFSDNDELATLLALGFDATALIICTSVGGFLDDKKTVIPLVEKIDDGLLSYISTDKSSLGLGGMLSKITFTRLATSLGIKVIITGLKEPDALRQSLVGNRGTTFLPQRSDLKARQRWLASGSITLGGIQVDSGAAKALLLRKSLLAVGIQHIKGSFAAGEVVQLVDESGTIIGVAKVKMDAAEIARHKTEKNALAAHADDIVLF
ncbi:glutamate 5-kinase [Pseudocnuella soli]|uniref:glutamate 5-kinase n=1 Tax=Pseudocnuella soli TaxID=2502779 RepID=UPI00104A1CCA|nr:glutamate 5-kinase [Pseudocnuella soli]